MQRCCRAGCGTAALGSERLALLEMILSELVLCLSSVIRTGVNGSVTSRSGLRSTGAAKKRAFLEDRFRVLTQQSLCLDPRLLPLELK